MSRKRIFTVSSLPILAALMMSPKAEAQIPITALKNSLQYYKKGKESFSLFLGATALQTGLMGNLRLYGNVDTDPQKHINDEGVDALSKLIKMLFPSPTGALSPETTRPGNFGKHATPKTVAHIFNFVDLWMEKEQNLEALISLPPGAIQEKAEQLSTTYQSLSKVSGEIKAYNQQANTIQQNTALSPQQKKDEQQKFLPQLTELKAQEKRLKEQKSKLEEELHPVKEKEIKKGFEVQKTRILNQIKESLSFADSKEQKLAFEEATRVLSLVENALQEKDTIYPKDTLLQVISTFFCEKFNTKDIPELLHTLNDNIVDHSKSWPEAEDYLTVDDLSKIASKERYMLEDVFFLLNAPRLHMPVPYYNGMFISNGNTYPYERSTDQILLKGEMFADCSETVVRHIFNSLLFNSETGQFDLSSLRERVRSTDPENPYFGRLEGFYKIQPPSSANNGDPIMRSQFNTVVAGLPQIRYKKNENEVRAGLVNLIRVFENLLGIKKNEVPETPDKNSVSNWLVESFGKIFEKINPDYLYEITPKDLVLEPEDSEISGILALKVSHKDTSEDLFSFDIGARHNKHDEVRNLKILKRPKEKVDFTKELFSHYKDIESNTAQDSLWLLGSEDLKRENSSYSLLYSLFSTPLQDNEERIKAIDIIKKEYRFQGSKVGKPENQDPRQKWLNSFLQHALKNLLKDMSWSDGYIVNKVSPIIFDLYEHEDLKEIVEQEVRGLEFPPEKAELYIKFKNLSYCDVSGNESLDLFDAQGMPALKTLILKGTNVKQILGGNFAHLDYLDVSSSLIEALPLQDMPNLQYLRAAQSKELGSLAGLKNLKNLTHLIVTKAKVENIELGHHPDLKKIIIRGDVKKVSEIHNFPALKKLEIEAKKLEEKISLAHLPNLSGASLVFSGKDLSIIDAPKLEVPSIRGCVSLENVQIKDAPALKRIEFNEQCPLKTLHMENLPKLEWLDLHPYSDIQSVTFSGNFSALSAFAVKNLEVVKGIENITRNPIKLLVKEDVEKVRTQFSAIPSVEINEY